ncbi:MAG: TetR/AcrR family transcriptional regulator [Lachnospiraceae bacterium]|nr:TetR/AcrR family transcriptional regulator [Lachnospiraceae bacterium]
MKRENQRVTLTKQLLTEALLGLLQKKPIRIVSVRELCEKAGINRTTFYHHYGSQYDLLNEISQRFLDQISERLAAADPENRDSVQERVTMVLAYLRDNRELAVLLLNNNIDPTFAERIFSLPKIGDLLDAALAGCADPRRKEATVAFAIHGSFRLLQDWINQEERVGAAEQAALILSLARRVCGSADV